MKSDDFVIFFLQLLLLSITAIFSGHIARRLKQPAVLGELIGGVIIGPTILGSWMPDIYTHLFKMSSSANIGREVVVKIGLYFFLFIAGMEIDLSNFRNKEKSILGASTFGIIIPFVIGFAAVHFFPSFWGATANQHPDTFALFLGTALSISALPVIIRILMDLNLVQTNLGMIVVMSATLNDIVGWSLFAVLLKHQVQSSITWGDTATSLCLVFILFVFMLTLGRWAAQKLLAYLRLRLPCWPVVFIGIAALSVYMATRAITTLGMDAIFGAFLVGIAFAPCSHQREKTQENVYQFIACFFAAPIYFVSVGLKTNFISNFNWPLVSVVFLIACLGKIVGVTLGARLGKLPFKEALAVGFAMNARGAMEIVLASLALEYKLIDERIFVALFIMALGTSILSGPMIKKLYP